MEMSLNIDKVNYSYLVPRQKANLINAYWWLNILMQLLSTDIMYKNF